MRQQTLLITPKIKNSQGVKMFKFILVASFSVFALTAQAEESKLCRDLYESGRKLAIEAKGYLESANKKLVEANELDEQEDFNKLCKKLDEAVRLRIRGIKAFDKSYKTSESAQNVCLEDTTLSFIKQNMNTAAENIRIHLKANDKVISKVESMNCPL